MRYTLLSRATLPRCKRSFILNIILNFLVIFYNKSLLQDDIPAGLKGDVARDIHLNESPVDKYRANAQINDCMHNAKDHNIELGFLNTTIR